MDDVIYERETDEVVIGSDLYAVMRARDFTAWRLVNVVTITTGTYSVVHYVVWERALARR